MNRHLLPIILAATVLMACQPATDTTPAEPQVGPPDADEASLARAEAAIGELGMRLRAALQGRMQAEGPLGAIDFCTVQAPVIASEVMQAHGVRLGRTSERVRNPANAATEWQAAVLRDFAANVADGEAPEAQRAVLRDGLPDGVALRFMRGIRVEAPCTLCHGREIDPGIAKAIAANYPDDAATGYREGELRGAFWVEVPAGIH